MQADQLPDFQVVTVDVSFISVTTILPALNAIVCAKQNLTGLPVLGVFLVKPQFEIPKQDLPDGGVVSDPRSRQQAVDRVQQTLAKVPFHVTKVLPSRVVGKSGNQEYFVIGDYQVSESPLPVLFLCTGNSCRSQMAEGWCRHLHGKALPCLSAGTEKHGMNPYAIKVMAEVGIDLNQQHSKTLDDLGDQKFATIYAVCDAAADNCPVVPGARVVRQTFDDPPKLTAAMSDEEEKLAVYRRVRDEIKAFVAGLV